MTCLECQISDWNGWIYKIWTKFEGQNWLCKQEDAFRYPWIYTYLKLLINFAKIITYNLQRYFSEIPLPTTPRSTEITTEDKMSPHDVKSESPSKLGNDLTKFN